MISDSDKILETFSQKWYFRKTLKSKKQMTEEKNIFLNLGLEYYFDDKTSLTLSGFYKKVMKLLQGIL